MQALIIIGTSMAILGTLTSAGGQYYQGQAEQGAYDYNADVMEQEADAEEVSARQEAELKREEIQTLISNQRVAYGVAGVALSEGSPLVVLAETAKEGEKEALTIRYGGSVKATSLRNRANLQRYYGGVAEKTGKTKATGTLLSGLGSAALNYGVATKT